MSHFASSSPGHKLDGPKELGGRALLSCSGREFLIEEPLLPRSSSSPENNPPKTVPIPFP